MNDPFAMRPFFGYNFGHYLQHWLDLEKRPNVKLPKIFHVNWFRKDKDGKFLWPGFGDNIRVLDWIFQRVHENKTVRRYSPIGYIPDFHHNVLNLTDCYSDPGSPPSNIDVNLKKLFFLDKEFWIKESDDIEKYFNEQVGRDLPSAMHHQIQELRLRLKDYHTHWSE
uniref:Phosphoenolpyruvate carboxykinase, cytosolic [GTP] n=1 Tax=Cacopsylla melanoneura TaxID=428564 RepID=A0A8D8Y4L6_9HEMI